MTLRHATETAPSDHSKESASNDDAGDNCGEAWLRDPRDCYASDGNKLSIARFVDLKGKVRRDGVTNHKQRLDVWSSSQDC